MFGLAHQVVVGAVFEGVVAFANLIHLAPIVVAIGLLHVGRDRFAIHDGDPSSARLEMINEYSKRYH